MTKTPANFPGYQSRRARFEKDRSKASLVYQRASELCRFLGDEKIRCARGLHDRLETQGILSSIPRLANLATLFGSPQAKLEPEILAELLDLDAIDLVSAAVAEELSIPKFDNFRNKIANIFSYVSDFNHGAIASYIPELADADRNAFALATCSIDGQQLELGDFRETFSIQSAMKPLSYALALSLNGETAVHHHVGREPSGRRFNELSLNADNRPHNPMINSGALVCSSLIRPTWDPDERIELVTRFFGSASGLARCSLNQSVFESELATASRNFALAELLESRQAFPDGTNITETLRLYFQSCAIEMNVGSLATMAATLANGGVCPTTGHRVMSGSVVRNTLSLMLTCGLYDFSGEYAFSVGLPAKSGVSGALMIVVPGVCGFGLWSPPLDRNGNSVRGIEFSKRLVEYFPFHVFSNVTDG